MQLEETIQKVFHTLGAVRAEVTRQGVATHWLTMAEAEKAAGKLRDMGLLHVETIRDNNCFAVFGKFPLPDRTRPRFNPNHPQFNPYRR